MRRKVEGIRKVRRLKAFLKRNEITVAAMRKAESWQITL
tara:strand:- start:54 stop:170 length:117 start_codon:yes stop_codon:yes gene_type:complete